MAIVRAAIEDPTSGARQASKCYDAAWHLDPISGEPLDVERIEDGEAWLCAIFLRPSKTVSRHYRKVTPWIDLEEPRMQKGRHCYVVNLLAEPD